MSSDLRPPCFRRAGFQLLGGPCYLSFRGQCIIGTDPQPCIVVQFSDGSVYRYYGLTEQDLITLTNAVSRGCFFDYGWRDSAIPYVRLASWPPEVIPAFTDDRAAVDPAFAHCS